MFSVSATKIASKATEGAIKIGGIASQKVADISASVGEKVSTLLVSFLNSTCMCSPYLCVFLRYMTSSGCLPCYILCDLSSGCLLRRFSTEVK